MVEQSVLENRIRVVTKRMEGVRSISLGFLMATGSMDEPEGQSGIAHLTEHLMFDGTERRSNEEIARMMDVTGGQVGGFTSRDYTCFTTTVLDDYRTYLIDLMGDILLNSQFADHAVHQEKETIIRELSAQLDRPDICAHERLKSHIWQGHPLGRPIGGSIASVARLQRQNVVDFFKANYQPRRLIVAAAGNVNHQDLVTNVADAFWMMKDDGKADTKSLRPVFHRGVTVECKGVSHVYFSIGLKASPYAANERYLIHLFTVVLGGGMSSRLFRKLRQELGMVYEISAEYQAYDDDGVIVIEGSTATELLHSVISQILLEIRGMASGVLPITEEELWVAKMQLNGQHIISQENSHTCMGSLATQAFYFDRFIDSEEICSQINEVNIDIINTITTSALCYGLQNLAISLIGPSCEPVCNTTILENMIRESL
ncbi:peptidase M16 domain protein [Desulfobulbus propionicus DSM 2032]|jgi:predicted Zn-dependent peptidase|uniref:Peptidase M16 domain protein n=1 Tax=Desulfobulbus propionicus (strain ATCC 33891 / DSM 2032 / VKM B-1956 / 1pr3) TaxID=577650 RepID=A0A7U3YN73_DESPD|nr:pitrilysin family protein [Desulfobulbus propionicus]ADW18479.1 peptidase M16 domain protein [Desulfobulbus propionicus DSM 2032]